MLAVGPLGPQYSLLFAWHDTLENHPRKQQNEGRCLEFSSQPIHHIPHWS